MKIYRQIVFLLYCAAVLTVCIYVPWEVNIRGIHYGVGYSPLWHPPRHPEFPLVGSVITVVRVVFSLLAVTATAGVLLLIGEVGGKVWSHLSFPLWLINKFTGLVLVVSVLGGWGLWTLYDRWQEQRRVQKVAEQKVICDTLWDRCIADNDRRLKQAKEEGKPITLSMYLFGCIEDKAYDECAAKVRELQTEDERRAEESQH